MIELDVHRCASGELVVMHDTTVDRSTDGVGPVACYTLHNLKKLDAGLGEKVPTLAEVFDFVQRRVIINVELKGIGTAALTAALIHKYVASHGWSYDDFLVSSFNINELTEFAQLVPQVPRGLLCSVFLPWKTCNDLKVSVVGIHVWLVTQDVIDEAHKRGIALFVFTVNNKNKVLQLKEMHVDGIFSDYPDAVGPIS